MVSLFFCTITLFLVLNLVLLHKTKHNGFKRETNRTLQKAAKGFHL